MKDDVPVLGGIERTRSFGDAETLIYAVDDATRDLYRGRLALRLWPSGSGESTRLAGVSGWLRPDSGQMLPHNGETMTDIWKMTHRQRERYRLNHCGSIFQGYTLSPALTARQ